MSINRCNISGNLTRDPEMHATKSGMAIMSLSVAVNERAKNPQTGEWEDRPNFVDCVLFGTRAERLSAYLSKGAKVSVQGKLRYSSWEKDGQRRSKLEVVVDELEFMSRRDGAQQQPQQAQSAPQWSAPQAYQAPPATTPQQAPDVYDSDIPF